MMYGTASRCNHIITKAAITSEGVTALGSSGRKHTEAAGENYDIE